MQTDYSPYSLTAVGQNSCIKPFLGAALKNKRLMSLELFGAEDYKFENGAQGYVCRYRHNTPESPTELFVFEVHYG